MPALVCATVIADTHFNALVEGGWECHSYLQAPEIVKISNSPDPPSVLKINYPAGFRDGTNPSSCTTNPAGEFSTDEIYVQVYVYYPAAYQFHTVGNKISYTYLEKAGDNPGNFFVAIFGTGSSRQVILQTQPATTKNGEENKVYYSNKTFIPINTDTWYKVSWYVKLNTSGVSNGIVRIWVNDTLTTEATDMNLRGGSFGTRKFYMTDLLPIFGGINNETKASADYFYFDRAIVSTTPTGEKADSLLILKEPAPPNNINIK